MTTSPPSIRPSGSMRRRYGKACVAIPDSNPLEVDAIDNCFIIPYLDGSRGRKEGVLRHSGTLSRLNMPLEWYSEALSRH